LNDAPKLDDKYWYPLYEKMVELQVPAMIHVSGCCNPVFHATSSHYLGADTTAFTQLMMSKTLFNDFPELKFVIPHGGGAVPYHWGRFRGLCDMLELDNLNNIIENNIYFDTCVYHQEGIDLLLDLVPTDNILFASEMIGAVRGIDPLTGHYFDDTKRYIDAAKISDEKKILIKKEGDYIMGNYEERDYKDIPGTIVFDLQTCVKGYELNKFCDTLNKPEAREAFLADEEEYMSRFPKLTEEMKDGIRRKDLNYLLDLGGNIYYLWKIAATLGLHMQQAGAMMSEEPNKMTTEEFQQMMINGGRPIEGNRSIKENEEKKNG
jgi:protocatechuate 4,5-dioxygenase alpha subunit